VGEVVMMVALALADRGGVAHSPRNSPARATSCSGSCSAGSCGWWAICSSSMRREICRHQPGIPLSNTNQLWGLLWGLLVFGELRGGAATTYGQVIGGSLLMALGRSAIALASATGAEHRHCRRRRRVEGARYGIDRRTSAPRSAGESSSASPSPRTWLDWILVGGATTTFIGFGMVARVPPADARLGWSRSHVAMLAAARRPAGCSGGRRG